MASDARHADPALVAEDDRARREALDVTRSFLVQAPAGSGKTELLIQRFLALLAIVERPEAIVAMTFTRKAAGEMRERIVAALRAARDDAPADGAHRQRTRELALRALARDEALGWQLCAHPARLAIVTIDAYCAGLNAQAPLAAKLAGRPRYVDRPAALYRRAVGAALAAASPDDARWRRLLAHLDNDTARLTDFIVGLLARREQWLPLLVGGEATRAALERVLITEVEGELAVAAAALPAELAATLARLLRHAADQLVDDPEALAWRRIGEAGGCPTVAAAALGDWRSLADWLLVKSEARLRATVTVRQGFPAAGRGAGAAERTQAKADMLALLAALSAAPGFAAALDTVRALPAAGYGGDAWAVAEALFAVLPQVAAHLTLVFAAERSIDFTQGTLAALQALGGGDDPQELLLRLDAAVAHLLLDEFQDTSYAQLELVSRLTSGWTRGDGRTLFAVGDPMQSIYRFRAAEVRLFVEAQQERRIGGLEVEPLALRRNFRSREGLVDWVNAVFPAVLGARSDPWQGAVAFAPAVAEHASTPGTAATLELVADPTSEAVAVVAAVRAAHAGRRDRRGAAGAGAKSPRRDPPRAAWRGPPDPRRRPGRAGRAAGDPRSHRARPMRCCSRPTGSPCCRCCARRGAALRCRTCSRSPMLPNGCRRSRAAIGCRRCPSPPTDKRGSIVSPPRSARRCAPRGRSRRRGGCAARGWRWAGRGHSTSRSTSTPPSRSSRSWRSTARRGTSPTGTRSSTILPRCVRGRRRSSTVPRPRCR